MKRLLESARVYDRFQTFVGANRLYRAFSEKCWGGSILDLGCGTGGLGHFISQRSPYVGVDLSPRYIEQAKQELPKADFHVGDATAVELDRKFDYVTAVGLLHHLDDDQVLAFAKTALSHLNDTGKLITVDNCYVDGQSSIAKFLISRDRGGYSRTPKGYTDLLATVFPKTTTEIRHNILRIPYTHVFIESHPSEKP